MLKLSSARNTLRTMLGDANHAVAVAATGTFFVLTATYNLLPDPNQQFIYLARAFAHGRLDLMGWAGALSDTVAVNGQRYWPLGPFPAILLAPFVAVADALGGSFWQGYLQLPLTVITFLLGYRLARRFGYAAADGVYLAFAFCFASVYLPIALIPSSWYFAHAVAVAGTLAAINEYCFGRRRYWLIGMIMGAVLMTRGLAGLGVVFFVAAALTERPWSKRTVRALAGLGVPLAVAVALLLGYNVIRFGTPASTGYGLNDREWNAAARFEQRTYGLFQLRNVPTNLYYYFIKTVDPIVIQPPGVAGQFHILRPPYVKAGYPGVSFFVAAPIFLYCFRARWRERLVRLALLPVAIISAALLTYFGTGWTQVGPRYTLDLLPFALLILLSAFPERRLGLGARAVIVLSAYVNFYLALTVYPEVFLRLPAPVVELVGAARTLPR